MRILAPQVIIAGAPKCGTSSLFSWLATHPSIWPSVEKETCFLVDEGTHMCNPERHVSRGLHHYSDFFRFTDCKDAASVRVEATPGYLYCDTPLKYANLIDPAPKFIFLLREPSAQIYSTYSYFKNNWCWIPKEMSFSEFVRHSKCGSHSFGGNELAQRAIEHAHYVSYLRKWKRTIGTKRMFVGLFEDMKSDPERFMQSVCEFIGISSDHFADFEFPKSNQTVQVRSHLMQRVALKLRARLNQGRMFDVGRRAYRFLNTTRPRPMLADTNLRLELSKSYDSSNRQLAEEFGLDLSAWFPSSAAG